ncbi:MAG: AarF/ABC1/UbiB kinase family protein [Pedobacter sp.]
MRFDEKESNEFPSLKRLSKVLPVYPDADQAMERLEEMLKRISTQKTPVSSFSRMWVLGSLQAKVAVAYLACWLRGRFAEAGEKERLRNETHLSAALQLLGAMGYLRGAVMKVGQMLANLPEVMPDEFAKVLSTLHFEAAPMHYALVREVFLDEFGHEPEDVFALFERRPFAAASLGQVHRARLHSGEDVAVKIQYPGIVGTIRADLRNLRLLLQPMRMTSDWPNLLDKLADIEQMLLMETDYLQEADFGKQLSNFFTPADRIVIPRIYRQYSTQRVLTTEYIHGCHLDEFLASDPGQELRDHFAHLITAATLRVFYRAHWLLADPNPGNYIFMDDGRLGLIDFGCTRQINDEEWELQLALEKAFLERDEIKMNGLIARACLYNSPEEMGAERLEIVGRGIRWQMEPWQTEGLFDFGDRDFFLRGVNNFLEIARRRYTRGMPVHIWSTRFILGARAMVFRLKGRCDFRKLYEQESNHT